MTNLKIRRRHGDQEEQNDIDKQIEGLSQLKHRETDSQAWWTVGKQIKPVRGYRQGEKRVHEGPSQAVICQHSAPINIRTD